MVWFPKLPFGEGPRYLQIVAALQNDMAAGVVAPGEQLPTHRDMAARLNLSVGTVSKAYAAAERRGLISGEVGRGTFVLPSTPALGFVEAQPANGARRVNLALNTPPPTGEDRVLARVIADITADPHLADLLGYLPHQGREDHRAAFAGWLSRHALPAEPGSLFITHGAQHAIAIALRLLARPGAPVLAENLTYSGMMALALMEGYVLHGVKMDACGLIPDELDVAFRESGAKVLYCTPTLQSTTGALMPETRRAEIAEVVRRHDGWIVEDDAYGFLCPAPLRPLSSFLPERSFYIVSFAKCLAPGLRIGAMTAPAAFRDRAVNAIRSTGWMANAIMAEAVARMIASGDLDAQIAQKRAAAAERVALARDILGALLDMPHDVPAFHVWMQMPAGRTASALVSQAAHDGITLAQPSPLQPFDQMGNGVRLCLGGAAKTADLATALRKLRGILDETEVMALV
jgi:DNA-binding transcriptional MocR family regulator